MALERTSGWLWVLWLLLLLEALGGQLVRARLDEEELRALLSESGWSSPKRILLGNQRPEEGRSAGLRSVGVPKYTVVGGGGERGGSGRQALREHLKQELSSQMGARQLSPELRHKIDRYIDVILACTRSVARLLIGQTTMREVSELCDLNLLLQSLLVKGRPPVDKWQMLLENELKDPQLRQFYQEQLNSGELLDEPRLA